MRIDMTLKGQRSNNIKNGKTSLSVYSIGLLTVAIALLYVTTIGQQSASALVSNLHINSSFSDEKGAKGNLGQTTNCDKNDDCAGTKHFNDQCNFQREGGCKFHNVQNK